MAAGCVGGKEFGLRQYEISDSLGPYIDVRYTMGHEMLRLPCRKRGCEQEEL